MPTKKRSKIDSSSAPNKSPKLSSEQGSAITQDSSDKPAFVLLKASTEEKALGLIHSGLRERPIHLLFTAPHASYFTGLNPLNIAEFKEKISDHFSGKSGCFSRKLEHKCKIAAILLSNPNRALYISLKKINHENYFLPFFVWIAKNDRADLFEISAFRKIFLEHKAAAKRAVLVAAAFGSTALLLKAIEGGFINIREIAKCLAVAAANGDNSLLSRLIEQNQKAKSLQQDQTPTSGATLNSTVDQPLFWAIRNKHVSTVELLLKSGQSPNETIDVSGDSYLMLATRGGNVEIMGLLLEHKANINYQDHLGNTALHYAAARYNPGVISILLENGARNLMDKNGHRPLDSIQIEKIPSIESVNGEELSNVDMPDLEHSYNALQG